jgi:hypothetical protein
LVLSSEVRHRWYEPKQSEKLPKLLPKNDIDNEWKIPEQPETLSTLMLPIKQKINNWLKIREQPEVLPKSLPKCVSDIGLNEILHIYLAHKELRQQQYNSRSTVSHTVR